MTLHHQDFSSDMDTPGEGTHNTTPTPNCVSDDVQMGGCGAPEEENGKPSTPPHAAPSAPRGHSAEEGPLSSPRDDKGHSSRGETRSDRASQDYVEAAGEGMEMDDDHDEDGGGDDEEDQCVAGKRKADLISTSEGGKAHGESQDAAPDTASEFLIDSPVLATILSRCLPIAMR